jgi:hypothetical protein
MTFLRRLAATAQILVCSRLVLCQTVSTSVTTLDGGLCATPSCTITPEAITSLTIQPDSTTVNVPGREEPLTFTFDSISVSSFQPDPTTIANDGDEILTLGTTTITDFPSASATQSYTVDSESTVTLTAAVTVKVQAEAQLFIAEESDPGGVCELFAGGTTRRQLSMPKPRPQQLRYTKRLARPMGVGPDASTFISKAVDEAEQILDAMMTFLDSFDSSNFPDNVG